MDNKFTNIKERVLYIAEFKGVSKEKFFENIGMTYGNFKGKSKETPLNSNAIADILSMYNDINPNWLIHGKGEMIIGEVEPLKMVMNESTEQYATKKEGYPLLPLEAFGGNGDESALGIETSKIQERYVVPLFEGLKIDFMIPVRGSSMYPKYNSGDVVACRIIKDLLYVQWNKTYVIDTYTQGTLLKRLKKSTVDDQVICKSDNKDYDEFELPKKDIRNIAMVVGVIRLE